MDPIIQQEKVPDSLTFLCSCRFREEEHFLLHMVHVSFRRALPVKRREEVGGERSDVTSGTNSRSRESGQQSLQSHHHRLHFGPLLSFPPSVWHAPHLMSVLHIPPHRHTHTHTFLIRTTRVTQLRQPQTTLLFLKISQTCFNLLNSRI